MEVVAAKAAAAVCLTLVSIGVFAARERLARDLSGRARWPLLAAWLVFRALPFVVIFLILRRDPGGDVLVFWTQASAAAQGQVVYRDFPTAHGPLFPYLLGLAAIVWHDHRSVIAMMIVVELVCLVATCAALARSSLAHAVRPAGLLYLVLPGPFVLVVLGGQEDTWIWLAGLGLALTAARGRSFLTGMLAGVGFLATKALFALPMAMTLFVVRRPSWYALGGISTLVPALVVVWLLAGDAVLMPLARERNVVPPNLWVLLDIPLGGRLGLGETAPIRLGLAATAALGCWFVATAPADVRRSREGFLVAWVFLFDLLLLLSVVSVANYTAFFTMPLTFLVVAYGDRVGLLVLLAINVVAAVQPSLWYRLGEPRYPRDGAPVGELAWLELALELVAIVAYLVLLWLCARWMAVLGERRGQPCQTAD